MQKDELCSNESNLIDSEIENFAYSLEALEDEIFQNLNRPKNKFIYKICIEPHYKFKDEKNGIGVIDLLEKYIFSAIEKEIFEYLLEEVITVNEETMREFERNFYFTEFQYDSLIALLDLSNLSEHNVLATIEGFKRVIYNLKGVIIYRELSKVIFDAGLFTLGVMLNQRAFFHFGAAVLVCSKYFDSVIRDSNRDKAIKRWKEPNQQRAELKKRYLKIMLETPFHSITKATDYIHAKENPEKKSHRWIYQKLSEATKGNFD